MQEILQATQEEAKQSRAMALQSQQMAKEMNKILEATQAETKLSRRVALQSRRLTEEMKKDSVAMKTVIDHAKHYRPGADTKQIALLTTFFLPGTSFAVRACR